MQQILYGLMAVAITLLPTTVTSAGETPQQCAGLPSAEQLPSYLNNAASGKSISEALGPDTDAGGVFGGARMWAAIVNRQGPLCVVTTSTADPIQVRPGSQSIAKAKAYTANTFSLDGMALSTARLYTMT